MRIHSAIRLPGESRRDAQIFDEGDEKALAKAASPKQLAYLTERGAISGFPASSGSKPAKKVAEALDGQATPEETEGTTETSTEADGTLPEGFPYADILADGGITTIAEAQAQRESEDGLEGVSGLGKARAKKVAEALDALDGLSE